MQTTIEHGLSDDKPLKLPEHDALGYAPVAKRIVDGLAALPQGTGFVLAIQGPWGAGKSTVLNFAEHYLTDSTLKDHLLIIRFNPWWFSGQEDLIRCYFDFLASALHDHSEKMKAIAKTVCKYASKVTGGLPGGELLKAGFDVIGNTLEAPTNVRRLKELANNKLRESKVRIAVVIDDIDRLTPEETRQVFRLVNAVADFDNIVYLLAYDRAVVTAAFQQGPSPFGADFLDKIVQASFDLPVPREEDVENLFHEQIANLVGDDKQIWNELYWQRLWSQGLASVLGTPRRVGRLLNALRICYPGVRGHVSVEDLVVAEAMRLFCPDLYDLVRRNGDAFADAGGGDPSGTTAQETQLPIYAAVQEVIAQDPGWGFILRQVFPLYSFRTAQMRTGSGLDEPSNLIRVACRPNFDTYFWLRPPSRIPMHEFLSLVDMAVNPVALIDELRGMTQPDVVGHPSQAGLFCEQLLLYIEDKRLDREAPGLLRALVTLGDEITRSGPDVPSDIATALIFRLLKNRETEDAVDILIEAARISEALVTVTRIASWAEYEHGKHGGHPFFIRPVFDENTVSAIRDVAIEKIQTAAEAGSLLNSVEPCTVISAWRDWEGQARVNEWVKSISADPSTLSRFIRIFRCAQEVQGIRGHIRPSGYSFALDELHRCFEGEPLKERVERAVASGTLCIDDLRTCNEYLRALESPEGRVKETT